MNAVQVMIVRHQASPERLSPHLPAHIAYLEKYHAAGTLFLSGPTEAVEQGGVLLACGVTTEEAKAISLEDPFVQHGLSSYEIISLNPRRAATLVRRYLGGDDVE